MAVRPVGSGASAGSEAKVDFSAASVATFGVEVALLGSTAQDRVEVPKVATAA